MRANASALPFAILILLACLCPTVPIVAADKPMGVATNLNEVFWYGRSADPFKDGFKDVRGPNPWRPEFIEDVKPYLSLRNLNWNKTNNPEREWERGKNWHKDGWAGRKKMTDPDQHLVAYEWQIDACNRAMCDYWVTIPHVVDDEYMRNLATLIKDQLNPKLKVWVEWSNECWNPGFTQHHFCVKKGQELELPGKDKWLQGCYYYGTQAARTFNIFQEVFGDQQERCQFVLAGWVTSAAWNKAIIEGAKDPKSNPQGIRPKFFAVATYGKKDTVALNDKIAKCAKAMIPILEKEQMTLITYEGGTRYKASKEEFEKNFIEELQTNGYGMFNNFCHAGSQWGAKKEIGEPNDASGKNHALWEYMLKIGQWNPQTQMKNFFDERGEVKFEPFNTPFEKAPPAPKP
jgi:hypothetical protein